MFEGGKHHGPMKRWSREVGLGVLGGRGRWQCKGAQGRSLQEDYIEQLLKVKS